MKTNIGNRTKWIDDFSSQHRIFSTYSHNHTTDSTTSKQMSNIRTNFIQKSAFDVSQIVSSNCMRLSFPLEPSLDTDIRESIFSTIGRNRICKYKIVLTKEKLWNLRKNRELNRNCVCFLFSGQIYPYKIYIQIYFVLLSFVEKSHHIYSKHICTYAIHWILL